MTSTSSVVGPEGTLLEPGPDSCRQIVLPHPIISNEDLAKIVYLNENGDHPEFKSFAIDGLYPVSEGGSGMQNAIEEIQQKVSEAISNGAKVIVLSDRYSNEDYAPIPSLLLTGAVHHHLVREQTRTEVGLIVECGDAREVHHMALLLGYGAGAVNPYLAIESIEDLIEEGSVVDIDSKTAVRNYIKACSKGVLLSLIHI